MWPGTQFEWSKGFTQLSQVVGLYLLDFTLFPDHDDVLSTYRLCDEQHNDNADDAFAMHFVDLTRFSQEKPCSLASPFETWLHVLKFAALYRREDQPLPAELAEEEGIAMVLDAMRAALADQVTTVDGAGLLGPTLGQPSRAGLAEVDQAPRNALDLAWPAHGSTDEVGVGLQEAAVDGVDEGLP